MESYLDVIKFIAREYFHLSHCDVPSTEKFNAMLYFCVRDAVSVFREPVITINFSFRDGCFVQTDKKLPSFESLLRGEPVLQSEDMKHVLRCVLPNYAPLDTWKLREMVLEACEASGFPFSHGKTYQATMKTMLADGTVHPPYNYYADESFIK